MSTFGTIVHLGKRAESHRRSEAKKISEPMCTKNVPGQFEDVSFFSKDVLWSQHLLFSSKSGEAKFSSFEDLFFCIALTVSCFWMYWSIDTLRIIPSKRCQENSGEKQETTEETSRTSASI